MTKINKSAKRAAATAAKAKPAATNANDNGRKELPAEYAALKFHFATISGGRKLPEGTKVEVVNVGVNRFNKEYAMVNVPGMETVQFIDPKFLTIGAKLPAPRIAVLEAEREAASSEVLIIPGIIQQERDKSVLLEYSGWFKGVWFPKTMIEHVGDHTDGIRKLYEVPAWKVRKDRGGDSASTLAAMQDELTEMVG